LISSEKIKSDSAYLTNLARSCTFQNFWINYHKIHRNNLSKLSWMVDLEWRWTCIIVWRIHQTASFFFNWLPMIVLEYRKSILSIFSQWNWFLLQMGQFLFAAKAFELLERADLSSSNWDGKKSYWDGKRGACVGAFQMIIAGKMPKFVFINILHIIIWKFNSVKILAKTCEKFWSFLTDRRIPKWILWPR